MYDTLVIPLASYSEGHLEQTREALPCLNDKNVVIWAITLDRYDTKLLEEAEGARYLVLNDNSEPVEGGDEFFCHISRYAWRRNNPTCPASTTGKKALFMFNGGMSAAYFYMSTVVQALWYADAGHLHYRKQKQLLHPDTGKRVKDPDTGKYFSTVYQDPEVHLLNPFPNIFA